MKELLTYLKDVFGITPDATATILISIVVFAVGQIVIGIVRMIQSSNKRSRQRKAFKELTNGSLSGIKKHFAYFLKTRNLIDIEDEQESISISRLNMFSIDLATKLGYLECYDSFFNGIDNLFKNLCYRKRLKAFHTIWEKFYLITYWENHAFESLGRFVDRRNKYNDERSASIKELLKVQIEITSVKESSLPEELQLYQRELLKIGVSGLNNTDKNKNMNIHKTHKLLIEPLRNLNANSLQHPLVTNQAIPITELVGSYDNVVNLYSSTKIQMNNYASIFKSSYRAIEIAVKSL